MAVIKEWKCHKCGYFESAIPICIHCGSTEVIRVFLTAPSVKSDKTKLVDDSLKTFAKQTGLTDYTNNKSTMHEKANPTIWQDIKTSQADIEKFAGGGVNISELKPKLPGKYEQTFHAEDLKRGTA